MADVLTVQDLVTAKEHDTFHSEVITGKAGGSAGGANIDYATNAVTGQVQKTLPKVLRDLGMVVQTWTATTGGTLTDASQVFLNDITSSAGKGNYYAWTGSLPKVVAAGTDPAAVAGFVMRSDAGLRDELTENGQTIYQIGMQTAIHHSGRVGYASLPRLVKAFINYDDAVAPVIQVLGLGSSVGNGAALPDPATQAPVMYLTQRLNARFNKLGNKTITAYNRSENGSSLNDGLTAIDDALAEPLTPKLVVLVFGMNDGATAAYNTGQTYPFVYKNAVTIIEKAKAAGSDVVVMTTPHPHSQRQSWSMPTGVPQLYPTYVAADVPDSALVPTVANSIKNIDATGNGVTIPVSYRHMRVNEAQRRAAADCGVPVIDAEWYWFKAVGDLGEDAIYAPLEFVHPNLLGHQLSYWAAIDDFVDSLTASVISGNQQSDFQSRVVSGLSETQAPLARNHLRQSAAATGEKVLRVDNAAGTRGMEVDASGNVAPIETIDSVWDFPRTTRKKLIYPGGSPIQYVKEFTGIALNQGASAFNAYTTNSNGVTEITIKATQIGIGNGWQVLKYMVNNKAGVLTLQSMVSMGDTIVNVSASGANIIITPVAASTDISFETRELYKV